MSQDKILEILVQADALFDTRLAILTQVDPKLAIDNLEGNYHTRRSDYFKGIEKEEFDVLYKNRDLETLSLAKATNLVLLLKDLVLSVTLQAGYLPFCSKVRITLNTYPYKLTQEVNESLKDSLRYWTHSLAPIEVVYISDEDLTPDLVKNQYDVMYRYDYQEWLEMHTEAFKHTRLMNVELYVPAISFTCELTDDELKDIMKEGDHPLKTLKFALASFIDFKPLDVTTFSLLNPDKF